MSPFKTLGLDDAADIATIRRAYARLLRTHRPDEDPVAFQRLHEAYEACLQQVHWRALGDDADTDDVHVDTAPDALRDTGNTDDSAPAAPQADTEPAGDEGFSLDAFFDEFLPAAREGGTDIDAWLRAHPALYSIADRARVADALVWRLLDEPALPPRALEILETVKAFGKAHVFPSDRGGKLSGMAVAHGEVDLSFMDDRRPRATKTGGPSWWWLVWIVFLVSHVARLAQGQ